MEICKDLSFTLVINYTADVTIPYKEFVNEQNKQWNHQLITLLTLLT